MRRTNIYLPEEKIAVLRHLAASEGQGTSVSDLIRQAIDQFLVGKLKGDSPWGQRLDGLIERVRKDLPVGLPEEQIEDDVTAARAEDRQARARRR